MKQRIITGAVVGLFLVSPLVTSAQSINTSSDQSSNGITQQLIVALL
jgi:hypothetical protein